MIAFDRVIGFEWDEGNSRKSVDRHGVGRVEAEQVFLNQPLVMLADVRHSVAEPRFNALGVTDAGRPLHVTFTMRQVGAKIRVISARDMHRRERARYGEQA